MASIEAAEDPYCLVGINNKYQNSLFLKVSCSDSLASVVKVLNLRDDCSKSVHLKVHREAWFRRVEQGGVHDNDLETLACAVENTKKNIVSVNLVAVTNGQVRGSVLRLLASIEKIPMLKRLEWNGEFRRDERHGVRHLTDILQRAKKLQQLYCRSIQFDGETEDFKALGKAIAGQKSLELVCFLTCSMADSNAKYVLTAVQQLPRLKNVALSFGCSFVQSFAEKKGLIAFHISDLGGQGLIALKPSLVTGKFANLLYLDVATTLIEEECSLLTDAVRLNTSIHMLRIKVGPIDDDKHLATCTLVDAIKGNSTLTDVSFHFSWPQDSFSEDLQTLFVNVLETNCTLERLYLGYAMEPSLEVKMKFYLKLNNLGRKKLLQNSAVPKEQWVQALSSAEGDISCLYYLLSANPALCATQTKAAYRMPSTAVALHQQVQHTKKAGKAEVPTKNDMRKRKRTAEAPTH